MPKYEVEINGWLLTQLERGNISIVGDSAFYTIEAESEQAAEDYVFNKLDEDPLSVGMIDEI